MEDVNAPLIESVMEENTGMIDSSTSKRNKNNLSVLSELDDIISKCDRSNAMAFSQSHRGGENDELFPSHRENQNSHHNNRRHNNNDTSLVQSSDDDEEFYVQNNITLHSHCNPGEKPTRSPLRNISNDISSIHSIPRSCRQPSTSHLGEEGCLSERGGLVHSGSRSPSSHPRGPSHPSQLGGSSSMYHQSDLYRRQRNPPLDEAKDAFLITTRHMLFTSVFNRAPVQREAGETEGEAPVEYPSSPDKGKEEEHVPGDEGEAYHSAASLHQRDRLNAPLRPPPPPPPVDSSTEKENEESPLQPAEEVPQSNQRPRRTFPPPPPPPPEDDSALSPILPQKESLHDSLIENAADVELNFTEMEFTQPLPSHRSQESSSEGEESSKQEENGDRKPVEETMECSLKDGEKEPSGSNPEALALSPNSGNNTTVETESIVFSLAFESSKQEEREEGTTRSSQQDRTASEPMGVHPAKSTTLLANQSVATTSTVEVTTEKRHYLSSLKRPSNAPQRSPSHPSATQQEHYVEVQGGAEIYVVEENEAEEETEETTGEVNDAEESGELHPHREQEREAFTSVGEEEEEEEERGDGDNNVSRKICFASTEFEVGGNLESSSNGVGQKTESPLLEEDKEDFVEGMLRKGESSVGGLHFAVDYTESDDPLEEEICDQPLPLPSEGPILDESMDGSPIFLQHVSQGKKSLLATTDTDSGEGVDTEKIMVEQTTVDSSQFPLSSADMIGQAFRPQSLLPRRLNITNGDSFSPHHPTTHSDDEEDEIPEDTAGSQEAAGEHVPLVRLGSGSPVCGSLTSPVNSTKGLVKEPSTGLAPPTASRPSPSDPEENKQDEGQLPRESKKEAKTVAPATEDLSPSPVNPAIESSLEYEEEEEEDNGQWYAAPAEKDAGRSPFFSTTPDTLSVSKEPPTLWRSDTTVEKGSPTEGGNPSPAQDPPCKDSKKEDSEEEDASAPAPRSSQEEFLYEELKQVLHINSTLEDELEEKKKENQALKQDNENYQKEIQELKEKLEAQESRIPPPGMIDHLLEEIRQLKQTCAEQKEKIERAKHHRRHSSAPPTAPVDVTSPPEERAHHAPNSINKEPRTPIPESKRSGPERSSPLPTDSAKSEGVGKSKGGLLGRLGLRRGKKT